MSIQQRDRRAFIAALGSAAAWPLVARAQQPERVRQIGIIMPATENPEQQTRVATFRQRLQQLGWTDGRNMRIDTRWTAGNPDDARKYAAELVALAPDVILAAGSTTVAPLLQAARTLPIVFVIVPDPVGAGFVDSLAQPGGNVTGFLQFEYSLSAKWLELLKQVAPDVTRAAILRDAAITAGTGQFGVIQSTAASVGMEVSPVNMRCSRDRTGRHGLRARCEWRADRDCQRIGGVSSRSDHLACGPAQTARGLLPTALRYQRWVRPCTHKWSARIGRVRPVCGCYPVSATLRGTRPKSKQMRGLGEAFVT
jgi:hypothetical protein